MASGVPGYFFLLGRMPNSGWPYSTGCPFSTIHANHFSAGVRLDFVHQFHGFHDAERLPGFHVPPTFTNASAPGLGEP